MKSEETRFVAIALIVVFSLMFYEGLIAIDASVTSIATHTLTVNLFGVQNPDVTYHAGLLFCIIGFVGMSITLSYFVAIFKVLP